jgi:hypothetical protein
MKQQKFKRGDVCSGNKLWQKDKEFIILYSDYEHIKKENKKIRFLRGFDFKTGVWFDTKNIDDKIRLEAEFEARKKFQYATIEINYFSKYLSRWSWLDEDGLEKIYELPQNVVDNLLEDESWENLWCNK